MLVVEVVVVVVAGPDAKLKFNSGWQRDNLEAR